MQKNLKLLAVSFIVILLGIFLVSCGDGKNGSDNSQSTPSSPASPSAPIVPKMVEPFSLLQATAANADKEIQLKALIIKERASRSGNSFDYYLLDKNGKGAGLIHIGKDDANRTSLVVGNYIQFLGKVVIFKPNPGQSIVQINIVKDLKVLEQNVAIPQNPVLSTLSEINNVDNNHKIVTLNNIDVILQEPAPNARNQRARLRAVIEGKNVSIIIRNGQTYEAGKYNLKDVVITHAGARFGSITIDTFSTLEKLNS